MMNINRFALSLFLAFSAFASPVKASDFEDDLNTVWEVLWDERANVASVYKWDRSKPHYYRITGEASSADQAHIHRALEEVGKFTGVQFIPARSELLDADLPVEYRFVKNADIDEKNGCQTETLKIAQFKIEKAIVKIRPGQGFRCIHHETMHLLGLRGHPSGKTVLTYFPWRRDVFLPLDQTMLKAWYHESMPYGAQPFKALEVMATQLAKDNEHGLSAQDLAQQHLAFTSKVLQDMAAFALGKGDVPAILWRSGRVSNDHLQRSKTLIAHALGVSKRDGSLTNKDPEQAAQWLMIAANRGYVSSQALLGIAYLFGNGVDKSPLLAAQWFGLAAAQKNPFGKTQYEKLMATFSDSEKEQVARAIETFKVETVF